MDAKTWEEVASFPSGGLRVHGIGWSECGRLWVSDTSSGTVMLMDAENGRIYDVFRVNEPEEVHGMTVRDNGEIWYCDAGRRDIGVIVR